MENITDYEKGYKEKEALEMAVKIFDEMTALNNGMSIEWRIHRLFLNLTRGALTLPK